MEIIETNDQKPKGGVAASITATILILVGIGLAGYFLSLIPYSTGITVWRFLLYSAAAYAPIAAGAIWLGVLKQRNRGDGKPNLSTGGLGFGILLIAAGVVMLGFSSGILPSIWKSVFISWQILLVAIGFIEISKLHFMPGFTLIIVGEFFIIPKVAGIYPEAWLLEENFAASYWPLLLIAFGVLIVLSMILRSVACTHKHRGPKCKNHHNSHNHIIVEEANSNDGKIDYNLVFTGTEQVVLDPLFRGGKISAVFAGATIDLRRTELPEGITYLKIDTVFGGANLYAPSDWHIEIRNNSVFGGFNDKRQAKNPDPNDTRRLVIVVNCVFGGGEVL